jgi:hypothetical protein
MMRYHEALSRCLEAVAGGRDLEAVIAALPARHHQRLREDATLANAVRRYAASVPGPAAEAEINALSRLNAELDSVRSSRERAAAARGSFAVPRFVLAGLLLAALLIGAGFLIAPSRGGNGTVEAAEFEGVVVASGDGTLTVQTLATLEEVMVPLEAQVLDENGAALQLGAIQEGEVVFVRGNREGRAPVRALDIRRRVDGLPGWCEENAERCRQIAQNLRDAQARCQNDPRACRLLHDRVTDLIARVTDVADLEDLNQRCRLSGGEGCRDITSFCRDHADVCLRDAPVDPVIDRLEEARERLRRLDGLCNNRDTRACRSIAQVCADHPMLCVGAPSREAPAAGETPISDQRPTR